MPPMTATAEIFNAPVVSQPDMVTLENVSWRTYERLLEETQEQHFRITYDQGRMVIMSSLPKHDKIKKLVGRMIETASLELDIPISSFGSTTWKSKDLRKGLEADECYYIKNEPLVRGRVNISLKRDPAPDLAVEVDITHNPLNRSSIYAALRVAEVWRYNGDGIEFLRRRGSKYIAIEHSDAFPMIRAADINRFLMMFTGKEENTVIRAFRDWVKTVS